jgi:hypothetical protein
MSERIAAARTRTRRHAAPGTVLALMLLAACEQKSAPPPPPQTDRLAALPLERNSVTVSGISAGGYMAVQFHVAHSSLVQGAGVIAAGPYYCAENSMRHALGRCMKGDSNIPVNDLIGSTSQLALDEAIDPIAGLADDRVWIFHGSADPVVAKPVTDALQAYYAALVDPRNIESIERAGAGHVFPTRDASTAPCRETASPFIGNCALDGARALLEHLYGAFPASTTAGPAGELSEFDQRSYAKAANSAGLAKQDGCTFRPTAGQATRVRPVAST